MTTMVCFFFVPFANGYARKTRRKNEKNFSTPRDYAIVRREPRRRRPHSGFHRPVVFGPFACAIRLQTTVVVTFCQSARVDGISLSSLKRAFSLKKISTDFYRDRMAKCVGIFFRDWQIIALLLMNRNTQYSIIISNIEYRII